MQRRGGVESASVGKNCLARGVGAELWSSANKSCALLLPPPLHAAWLRTASVYPELKSSLWKYNKATSLGIWFNFCCITKQSLNILGRWGTFFEISLHHLTFNWRFNYTIYFLTLRRHSEAFLEYFFPFWIELNVGWEYHKYYSSAIICQLEKHITNISRRCCISQPEKTRQRMDKSRDHWEFESIYSVHQRVVNTC
jgi:hypothetical protein